MSTIKIAFLIIMTHLLRKIYPKVFFLCDTLYVQDQKVYRIASLSPTNSSPKASPECRVFTVWSSIVCDDEQDYERLLRRGVT